MKSIWTLVLLLASTVAAANVDVSCHNIFSYTKQGQFNLNLVKQGPMSRAGVWNPSFVYQRGPDHQFGTEVEGFELKLSSVTFIREVPVEFGNKVTTQRIYAVSFKATATAIKGLFGQDAGRDFGPLAGHVSYAICVEWDRR